MSKETAWPHENGGLEGAPRTGAASLRSALQLQPPLTARLRIQHRTLTRATHSRMSTSQGLLATKTCDALASKHTQRPLTLVGLNSALAAYACEDNFTSL